MPPRRTPLHHSPCPSTTAPPPFHHCTPRMTLGEAPIYRATDSTLHWVECLANPPTLHILPVSPSTGAATGPARVLPLAESVTVACFRRGRPGSYVAAYYAGIAWLDEASGALEVVREIVPRAERGERRMNDGGVDAAGRFWVAEIDLVAAAYGGPGRLPEGYGVPRGRLWRFDPEGGGGLKEMETGLVCGNGVGWSPDDRTMYLNDSAQGLVYAYDFDLTSGELSNKRILVDRRGSYGEPDGMVVDTDGNLWIAVYASDRVMVFSPQGEHLRDVLLPARNPTCTTWGGQDFDILFITTASDRANESDENDEGGHMFKYKPDGGVKGFAKHEFAG
ncbi:hypothetical protein BP6252_06437 [Neofusicoccum parvum]|uniref:Uncharacterized protein n=1 Tax=Neofusicoccum parvum TaxID=310453 RepID=A0ACB5SC83_9PEZI|nr:hypothetical protein BP6252_06437 [Neofusicoccum parvum]